MVRGPTVLTDDGTIRRSCTGLCKGVQKSEWFHAKKHLMDTVTRGVDQSCQSVPHGLSTPPDSIVGKRNRRKQVARNEGMTTLFPVRESVSQYRATTVPLETEIQQTAMRALSLDDRELAKA